MLARLHGPGFLGTPAPFISDFSLCIMLLVAALLTFGRHLARTGRYGPHRWIQTASVILSTIVALGFMIESFFTHILPGVPSKLLEGDYAVSTLHALLGSAAVILGVFVVLRGHELVPRGMRFSNYKAYMRTSYALYMLATLLGVVVYVLVFVFHI